MATTELRQDATRLIAHERLTLSLFRGDPPAPGDWREPDGRIVVEDGVVVERSGIAIEGNTNAA